MRRSALLTFFVCLVAATALTPAAADDQVRTAHIVNVQLADAATVLRRFASRPDAVRVDEARRTLTVADTASKMPLLARVMQALEQARPGQEVWLEPARGLDRPSRSAERLTEIFAPGSGTPATDPVAKFVADDETGALVIVADENTYRRVLELLARGAPDHRAQGEVRVVPLEHADARAVVQRLSRTFAKPAELRGALGKPGGKADMRATADLATNSVVLTAPPRMLDTLVTTVRALDVPPSKVLLEVAVKEEPRVPEMPPSLVSMDDEARRKLWTTRDARILERTVLLTAVGATNELRVDMASASGDGLRGFRVTIAVVGHASPDLLQVKIDVATCTRPGTRCEDAASNSILLRDTETAAIRALDRIRSNLLVVVTPNTLRDDVDLAWLLRQRQLEREEARVAEALFGPARKLAPLRVHHESRGLVGDIRLAQLALQASP
jgi:hypothetical protein